VRLHLQRGQQTTCCVHHTVSNRTVHQLHLWAAKYCRFQPVRRCHEVRLHLQHPQQTTRHSRQLLLVTSPTALISGR
jgi:hypothetical protein